MKVSRHSQNPSVALTEMNEKDSEESEVSVIPEDLMLPPLELARGLCCPYNNNVTGGRLRT